MGIEVYNQQNAVSSDPYVLILKLYEGLLKYLSFVKASMVALNVDTPQAEQLALAMNVGAIHLALRGPADVNIIKTDGVNIKVMERSKQRPPKYKPKTNRDVIQIMQGDKLQEVITR